MLRRGTDPYICIYIYTHTHMYIHRYLHTYDIHVMFLYILRTAGLIYLLTMQQIHFNLPWKSRGSNQAKTFGVDLQATTIRANSHAGGSDGVLRHLGERILGLFGALQLEMSLVQDIRELWSDSCKSCLLKTCATIHVGSCGGTGLGNVHCVNERRRHVE